MRFAVLFIFVILGVVSVTSTWVGEHAHVLKEGHPIAEEVDEFKTHLKELHNLAGMC